MASNLLVYTNVPKVPDERICPICSEEAPPGETHHPHYGGICCYGCRAFFRRANQRTKKSKLKCKSDGNCEIAPKGQARCKKCRYEKCLSVGMDPKWVMTNEQKKIRFQHYFKKKQEREAAGASTTTTTKMERPTKRRAANSALSTSEGSSGSSQDMPELIPIERPLEIRQDHQRILPATGQCHTLGTARPTASTIACRSVLPSAATCGCTSGGCTSGGCQSCHHNMLPCSHKGDDHKSFYVFCGPTFTPKIVDSSHHMELPSETTRAEAPNPWSTRYPHEANNFPTSCSTFVNNYPQIAEDPKLVVTIKEEPMEVDLTTERKVPLDNLHQSESLQSLLTRVLDAFTLTCGKLNPNSDRAQDLVLAHQRRKPLEKMTIITQLSTIASMITEFATSLAPFRSIPSTDQLTLLKCNIPLYLQYVMARYFSSSTGLEQLSWILEGQLSIPTEQEVRALHQIGLSEYNISTGLFSNAGVAELYKHYSESIGMFYQFPQHYNGIVANLLLYRTNESMLMSLKEPVKIKALFDEAQDLVKLGLGQIDRCLNVRASSILAPLIQSLETMKNIFDTCQIESTMVKSSLPNPLFLSYTETEEKWLRNKFLQFQTQFLSATVPADYLEEALNLLRYGKDVRRSYVSDWINLTKERMRRVLTIHPEFLGLSDNDQIILFRKNYLPAVAIAVSHLQLARSGKEQIRLLLGNLDKQDTSWMDGLGDVETLDCSKPALLCTPCVNKGRIDEASIRFVGDMLKEVAEMVYNDQIYQLFALVTLLDTEGLPNPKSYAGVMKMRQIYLRLFQRKLNAAGCSYIDYSGFQKTLRKLKILGNILKNFFD